MTNCPICDTRMKKEKREVDPGVYSQVEVCSQCSDEWLDEEEYETLYNLFKRKAFKIGGSVAVRIPKEIADAVKLQSGSEVRIRVDKNKIIVEPIS